MSKRSEQPTFGCSPCVKGDRPPVSDSLILEALKHYGLEGNPWTLIRHNENMTVQVGERYLLRIHVHKEGFSTDAYYEGLDRMEIRRTELAFLLHLAAHGMPVQTPVPNRNGEYLTVLSGGVCATLLKWLPGHTPNEEDVAKDVYFRAGVMTAKLHRAAAGFHAETILHYDASLCRRLLDWLAAVHQEGLLAAEHAHVLREACRVMGLRLGSGERITVHADLSSSNIIVTKEGLVPIDFSLMGVGHPMMDISSLYGSVNGVDARKAIAEGYRAEGGVISFPELDACFALNILLYIVLHLNSCAHEERFINNLNRWSRQTFQPLADGKRLIGDDFRMLNVPDSV